MRSWDYATGTNKLEAKLTVTDKRIVNEISVKNEFIREEIALKDINSLSMSYKQPSKLAAILMIAFGIILLIVGIVLGKSESALYALSLLGLFPLIFGILNLFRCGFVIYINPKGITQNALTVGASTLNGKKAKRRKIKIHVSQDTAKEIIETLGAITLGNL